MTILGGCSLTEHDPDPDSRDHRILPGQWVRADCTERDEACGAQPVKVWSSLSDTTGDFGEPLMFTEWGTKDGKRPIVADLRYLSGDKRCEHLIYKLASRD